MKKKKIQIRQHKKLAAAAFKLASKKVSGWVLFKVLGDHHTSQALKLTAKIGGAK